MTLGELRNLVRLKLNDNIAPYLWSDEFLNLSINQAQNEALVRMGGVVDDYSPTVTHAVARAGVEVVALNPAIMRVESIITPTNTLQATTPSALQQLRPSWTTDTGVPSQFFMGEGCIRLYPIPETDTALSMVVRRGALTPLVVDTQRPELPPNLHSSLLHWVMGEAYSIPDSDIATPDAADRHFKAFEGVFGPVISAKSRAIWAHTPARSSALMRRL